MYELKTQRVPFTPEADATLRMLKARTGITPNILCRLALCLSLDEPGRPQPLTNGYDIGREINRYTLFGEHDSTMATLLFCRMKSDGIDATATEAQLLAHLHRGIALLAGRVKSVADLANLLPAQ